MKQKYLETYTKDNVENQKKMNKQKKKETNEQRLNEIEEQIDEGIRNGTIPVITYREVKIFEKIFHESKVNEESSKYKIKIQYPHDKLIKTVLSNEEEVAKVLNNYLGLKLKAEQLEKYKSSYITKTFKSYESDIVYKIKNKKIFFLIEHQSKVDRTMPYRMHEYTSAIMKEAINKKEERKDGYLYPKVISVVIYTGKEEWNVETKLEEIQERLEYFSEFPNDSYKLIDANNYTEKELLNDGLFTSKIIFVERESAKNKNNIANAIEKVVNTELKDNESKQLYEIIQYIWGNNLNKQELEGLLNKLKSGGEVKMTLAQILYEEHAKIREEGKREGRREGIVEIVRKMIKNNLTAKEISTITEIDEEEIEKIIDM